MCPNWVAAVAACLALAVSGAGPPEARADEIAAGGGMNSGDLAQLSSQQSAVNHEPTPPDGQVSRRHGESVRLPLTAASQQRRLR